MICPGVQAVKPSATLVINQKSADLTAKGREVFRLGFGQSPFPVPAPVVEHLKQHAHIKDYLPVKGYEPLRGAVAEWCGRQLQLNRGPEDVLIGPGSKELIFILQTVLHAVLILPAPSWVSYAPQAHLLSRPVNWLQAKAENNWQIEAEDLDILCQSIGDGVKLLILNYPNNPTGVTFETSRLQALAEVARRHSLIILSDEIYGEVHHAGNHCSIARFYEEGTIVSTGISKWCGAGGWRLGAFIFPPHLRELLEQMAIVASETYTSASAPIQYAAIRAYQPDPEIESYLETSRNVLSLVARYVHERLGAMNLQVVRPEGGFYLFPDFEYYRHQLEHRGIASGSALCERLLEETGIALLPGVDFGMSDEALFVRLSYVDFDGEFALNNAMQQHLKADVNTIRVIAPKIHEAMERLSLWLQN